MNLHGIVAGAVGAINPLVVVKIEVSTGNTPGDDGIPIPTYARPIYVKAQIQPLSGGDIRQLEFLNLQGEFKGIYIDGHIDGLVRSKNKGGDKITMPNGDVYLVTTDLESWPDWTKVAATLQNGA